MELFKLLGTIAIDNGKALQAIGSTTSKAESAAAKMSSSFNSLGSGFTKVGSKLTNYVTKPAIAAGGAMAAITLKKGWDRAVEIDNARVKLKAIGLSADEVTTVMDNATAAVKGTAYGLDEAATVAASAVASGIEPGKELESYLTAIGDAAAVAGTDMNDMGYIFNKVSAQNKATNQELGMLAERGIPIYQWLASEIGCTAEEVFEMASHGEIDLALFQAAVSKNIGGAAKEMGSATVTGAIANIGASISRIGANFLGSADDANSFMGQIKSLLKEFMDWLEKVEEKAKVWGATFGEVFRAVVAYIRSGGESFGELSESAQGVFDKIKPIIDVAMGIANAFMSLSPKMRTSLVVGAVAAGPLLKILGSLFKTIGTILSVVSKFQGAIRMIISIGGKLLTGIGKLITLLGKLGPAIKIVKTALSGLFMLIKAHPVIAVITAIVAAFLYLWNNCEAFREFWINLWEKIKEIAVTVWEAIKGFFIATWEAISSAAQAVWNGIKDFFSGLWEGIKNIFTAAVNGISTFLSGAWNAIKTVVTTIWTGISTFFGTIWNGIKTIITTVVSAIQNFIANAWNTIKTTITTVLNAIKATISTIWNGIKSVVITVLNAIKSGVSTVWNGIKTVISTVLNAVKNTVSTVWNGIKGVIQTVSGAIKNIVGTAWNGIKSTVSGTLNGVKSAVSAVWNAIKTITSNVFGSIKNVASKTWNGIKKAITTPIEKAKDVVKKVIDKIKEFFKFNVSLPKIKLPHFSIKPKGWNIGDLLKGSIPKLGVEWYAKGGILNRPAIFGINPATGSAMAGGEAGEEAVAPIDTLTGYVKDAVREENEEQAVILQHILAVLREILEKDTGVYLDGKEITKTVNKNLGVLY